MAFTAPADGAAFATGTVNVTGTVSDAHLDTVTVNGNAATVAAGAFQAGITLVEGDNVLRVRAVDLAGNATEVERTVALDTRAPEVTVTDPALGTVVGESTYALPSSPTACTG